MIGADAIGRLAIGQAPGSLTIALTAASGSFTFAGQAATFQTQGVSSLGSLALTGASVTFQLLEVGGLGSFALAGQPANFYPSAVTGFYALAGQASVDLDAEIAGCGLFAWTGERAYLSYDLLGGGGAIVAGTFSRKKWREIQDELAAEEEAKRRRIEDAKRTRRQAREAAEAERKRRFAETLATEDAARADAAMRRQIEAALAALSGAQRARDELGRQAILHAALTHAHAKAEADARDEDEATALLLAA